jgi:hypothetical protein
MNFCLVWKASRYTFVKTLKIAEVGKDRLHMNTVRGIVKPLSDSAESIFFNDFPFFLDDF